MRYSVCLRAALTACFGLQNLTPNAYAALGSSSISLISADHTRAIYKQLVENHWVARTGLFMSFPDSTDRKL